MVLGFVISIRKQQQEVRQCDDFQTFRIHTLLLFSSLKNNIAEKVQKKQACFSEGVKVFILERMKNVRKVYKIIGGIGKMGEK